MQLKKIYPDKNIAGIMAMAIISNTLNFTAPSTSSRDLKSFEWLIKYFDFNKSIIKDMFGARSSYNEKSTIEILESNMKTLKIYSNIGISQIETISPDEILKRDDLQLSVKDIIEKTKLNHIILSIVDIYRAKTYVMVFNKETKEIVEKSMSLKFINMLAIVDKILLRKTDYFPKLKEYYKNEYM
jgi:manganese-dependent inorganic pyrophosphatase